METIYAAMLPGFYRDERGAYGIILGAHYICCFINIEDDRYDVTVDTVDANGDFALNLEWASFDEAEQAITCLRRMVRVYKPKR